MLFNVTSEFYHNKKKCRFFSYFPNSYMEITVSALTSVIFIGSFWNVALRSQTSSIMDVRSQYAHNEPLNEPIDFGIPGVTKFGANVGLNIIIEISSGFCQHRKKWWNFYMFSNFAHPLLAPSNLQLFLNHFQIWQNNDCPRILDNSGSPR